MKVLVLIAGVHDPKWPIANGPNDVPMVGEHQILSPFDEAALEMALRIRDANPETIITARVAGGPAAIKIARAVAALHIADVATVTIDQPWDQSMVARALALLCDEFDLVLMGREFGDYDDGFVPPLLAGLLDLPFFGRAQTVDAGPPLRIAREANASVEALTLSGPSLVSVTNDRRTRLRKPLMKNVMMARTAAIGDIGSHHIAPGAVTLQAIAPRAAGRSQTECRMLEGDLAQQAQALAVLLWEARA